jgi:crotonobetaine/carnitine-CoA ligase
MNGALKILRLKCKVRSISSGNSVEVNVPESSSSNRCTYMGASGALDIWNDWRITTVIDTVAGRTAVGALRSNAQEVPDKTFIEFNEREISYRQVWDFAERAAAGLEDLGVKHGTRVMLHLRNCPDYLVAWFAVTLMGGVVVTCSPDLKADEIRHQLQDSESSIVIVSTEATELVQAAADAMVAKPIVVTCEPGTLDSGGAQLNRMLCEDRVPALKTVVGPDDLATIMYTSGTTARPKGVLLTHGNLIHFAQGCILAFGINRFDRVLHYYPLHHANGGIVGVYPALLRRATIVMIPKFSSSSFVTLLRERRITFATIMAVNVKYLLETEPTEFDSAHECYRAVFALQVDSAQRLAFTERFGVRLVHIYAQTEALPICSAPMEAEWTESCGPPLPGYQLRIVDDQGEELPVGGVGEILIRSLSAHGLFSGYLNDDSDDRPDGWFRTGDMGSIDEMGYLTFIQRKKDMLKRSGYNVAPAEVERALLDHPSVADAVVVGIPDRLKEEAIVAFVVPSGGGLALDEAVLLRHCKEMIADYKVPQRVLTIEAMPEDFLGKVDRKGLRRAAVEQLGDMSA